MYFLILQMLTTADDSRSADKHLSFNETQCVSESRVKQIHTAIFKQAKTGEA